MAAGWLTLLAGSLNEYTVKCYRAMSGRSASSNPILVWVNCGAYEDTNVTADELQGELGRANDRRSVNDALLDRLKVDPAVAFDCLFTGLPWHRSDTGTISGRRAFS